MDGYAVPGYSEPGYGGSPPGTPHLTATPGAGAVTLTWTAVPEAAGYSLYWATAPGVAAATATLIEGAASPYAHTGRQNGQAYYYRVAALGGALSAEVAATPQGPITGVPADLIT